MSIKSFDKNTGKWTVHATNIAQDTYVVDGEGNYEGDNVEAALKEIADELDSLNDRVEYIYENGTIGGNAGGGGMGSSSLPTLTLSSEATMSARTDETVDIYVLFQTPNLGNATLSYSVTSTYNDSEVELDDKNYPNYESFSRTVTPGRLKISIPGRETGVHKVNIYVVDSMGMVSNSVDVTINSGALEVRKLVSSATSNYFDDSVDTGFGDPLKIGYRISALDVSTPIQVHILVNGVETVEEGIIGVNEKDYGLVSDLFTFVGNHRIELYVTQGSAKSNTILWNITVADSEHLIISSPMNSELTQVVGKTTAIEFRISMQGYSRFLTRVTISGGGLESEELLNSDNGINTWSLGTILDQPNTTYTLTIQSFTTNASGGIGDYSSNILQFLVTVTASEGYEPFSVVTDGAVCIFDATGSNNSSERNIWRDKRGTAVSKIVGKLNGFNYSTTSGWNPENSSLAFSGKANVQFYTDETFTQTFNPFKDGVGVSGFTVDIRFKTTNIGDIDSKILWCQNNVTPFQGFNVGIDTAQFTSSRSNAIQATFREGTWLNITYVFYKPTIYNAQNQNMLILYINGVLSKAMFLADRNDDLVWNGPLMLGCMINNLGQLDHYATCEVSSLRIYNRALTDDEILQNFIADHKIQEEQMAIRERNYGEKQIPTMTITCPNYDSMTDETTVDATVVYTDPADPGKNFQKDGCRLNWQGTSSRSYPVKNYTLRLRSGGNDWLTYKPKDDWMPEARYTLKAN